MHKHKETNIILSSDLIIDKSKSRPSTCMKEAIEHIQDMEACFVFNKGHLYPILYQGEVCGCLWEYIPKKPINNGIWAGSENAVHFGIFTYPNIRGKKLHVVQKYLEFRSGHDLYLHTMKKCKIADFCQSRYGFSFHAQDNNHIVLKKTKEKTQMRIIITADSTREPIDEVRCITNSSTGSLGVKIAQEFRKNRSNLVLANDISEIRAGNHNGMLVFPEKTKTIFSGKQNIAENLVKTTLIRQAVHHHSSILTTPDIEQTENILKEKVAPSPFFDSFYNTGKWLRDHFFLPAVDNNVYENRGTYGNMSLRLGSDDFIMTGRNVNKGDLHLEDLVYISEYKRLDPTQDIVGEVYYNGIVKPSIDAPIHAEIYNMLPSVKAMIHVHTNINFKNAPSTTYNFPCGCEEEVQELIKLIHANPESSILQMVNHGLLIMGDSLEDCQQKLEKFYQENLPINELCFHATYAKNIPSILQTGLVPGIKSNWNDMELPLVCMVTGCEDAPDIALSFCETADNVPAEVYDSGIVILAVHRDELHKTYLDPNILLSEDEEMDEELSCLAVSEPIPPEKLIFFQSYLD